MIAHSFPADRDRADPAVQTEKCLAVFDPQNVVGRLQQIRSTGAQCFGGCGTGGGALHSAAAVACKGVGSGVSAPNARVSHPSAASRCTPAAANCSALALA